MRWREKRRKTHKKRWIMSGMAMAMVLLGSFLGDKLDK